MGLDFYLSTEPEVELKLACWRNIANEPNLQYLLEKKKCTFWDHVDDGEGEDWDDEKDELIPGKEVEYADAKIILGEAQKARKIVAATSEKKFSYGRAPLLNELDEILDALKETAKHGAKARFSIM